MGVCRHLETVGMGHSHDRSDLVGRHLGLARHAAESEHRAGRDDLQEIRAAGHRQLGLLLELLRPTGHAHAHLRRNLRLRVPGDDEVPAAARDRQVEPRRLDARPDGAAGIDRIAQVAVGPRDVGAHVTRSGEAGEQRRPRVLERDRRLVLAAATVVHTQVSRVARPVRQVRVHVDQPRQAGHVPEIELRDTALSCDRGGSSPLLDRDDPASTNRYGRRPEWLGRQPVDHVTAMDRDGAAVGLMWCSCDRNRDVCQRRARVGTHCSECREREDT